MSAYWTIARSCFLPAPTAELELAPVFFGFSSSPQAARKIENAAAPPVPPIIFRKRFRDESSRTSCCIAVSSSLSCMGSSLFDLLGRLCAAGLPADHPGPVVSSPWRAGTNGAEERDCNAPLDGDLHAGPGRDGR